MQSLIVIIVCLQATFTRTVLMKHPENPSLHQRLLGCADAVLDRIVVFGFSATACQANLLL